MKKLLQKFNSNKQILILYVLIVKIIVINMVFKQEVPMKQKHNFIIV